MPSIIPRRNKTGDIVSYRIRVARGYGVNGKQLKPYEMTWKPPKDMTAKQIEKELKRQAALFEESCKVGMIGVEHMRLVDFCSMYLDIKAGSLAPRTHEYYANTIRSLIVPTLGHMKLEEIRPGHVQQFIQLLQNETVRDKKGTLRKLSPATVKRKLAILQSIMRQALKLGLITANPADGARLTLPKAVTPQTQIFTKQEAAAMLECLEQEPLQFQVMIRLAIMTGCRLGELVGLQFGDFDDQTNKVTIARSAYKLKGQPVQTKAPKDNDVRTVAVSSDCIALVRLLQQEKQQEAMRIGSKWCDGDWLFTQWNGEIMYPQTPSKQFAQFLKKNGFAHRKFHALRHTSATLLLYGGVNIKQVQERLGHGDMKTTNIYLHCIAEADEQAANVLQELLITHKTTAKERSACNM